MRKLAVTLALASTALASPALARDKSWYVGVEGGTQIVEDINYDIGSSPLENDGVAINVPAANNASVTHHYGYDVDGVIGYDFGHFRAEAEVGYRRSNISGLNYATGTTVAGAESSTGVNSPGELYTNVPWAGGATSALSFMVNGLLDFGPDNGLQGFIGGGVGVAQIKANYGVGFAAGDAINDSDTVFAWQVLAGIRAPINKHVDFSLKYRFFNADDVVLYDTNGSDWHGRYRSHSILGGIIFNFGEPAAPPPPPPPVPTPTPTPQPYVPPAPTPQTVCTPGPYIVFFGWNKSDITPDAASILDNAIANYQNCSNTSIMIAGYTDTSGTPKYNLGLSDRRADAVKAYFAGKGIAPGVITTHGFGETNLRVQTADGVREPQNRRVEINYGPGAGN